MEISPKALREVEFREKLRGYHPEDVDEFVERVASGIEALQERLRLATERAVHAEQLAAETGEQDDAIKRTLILAQRTADMAVEEAQEQARTVIEEAQAQAGGIVGTAREEAEAFARQAQEQLRSDLDRLTVARDQLQEDVGALEAWLAEHKSSLSAALFAALQRLEAGLSTTTPPVATELDVPEPVAGEAPIEGEASALITTDDDAAADVSAARDDDTGEIAIGESAEDDDDADGVDGSMASAADGRNPDAVDEADPTADGDEAADGDPVAEDDPFMAELRRAVDDEEPLGPRDDDEPLSVPPGHERVFEDGPDGRRFSGRRRRRR
jgi:cell division initiation protein